MNSEKNARKKAAEVLGNPVILQGAWMRVESWYRSGDLSPQPELSRWRLYPEAMLRELAEALRDNRWKPEQWRQVPYPKKGARLRHYVMPTVRDQVAFMAHMVALGPILDAQVANFAFGNRWYRPIAWDHRAEPARWVHRPYPMLTDRIFLSYPRSHGLFRRVAHWTVAQMTKAALPAENELGRVQVPKDYRPGTLPPWTRKRWWEEGSDTSRAFWAALDIELAYPSVRINRLTKAMEQALRRPIRMADISMSELLQPVDFQQLFDGCPKPVSEALAVEDVRLEIGQRMTRALGEITLDPCGIPRNAWGPPRNHSLPRVVEPYDGIPTGLAISGVLLNVALLEADQTIYSYLERTSGEKRGAIVRFADDMYVLSRSPDGLLSLIEAVHGALSGVGEASLAMPNEASNICINFKKLKPEAVHDVVDEFLLEYGWKHCEKCKQPLPPSAQEHETALVSVSNWWAAKSSSNELAAQREALERTAIKQGDVGPFVTSLVERLSDMGTDTLRQRFGEGARDHLARLHELARFDIEDEQVRPDTRRAFSVNRLVRAWLPAARETGEQHRELRRIRETIGFVLDRTPWKFAIWRAVVRGAARCPLDDSGNERNTNQEASEWLTNQLRRIACAGSQRSSAAWLNAWPETDSDDGHEDDRDGWQKLYLSFIRAAFWRALAQVVRELERHAAQLEDEEADGVYPRGPSPFLWTTRAAVEGGHAQVAESLGQIDQWVDVLYPAMSTEDIAAWPWELDEFVGAILAVHSTVELTQAWRRTTGPGSVLRAPITARLEKMPRAKELLSRFQRLREKRLRRGRRLDNWSLANVQLGHWNVKLGHVLFPAPDRSRISRAGNGAQGVLAAGLALGCFKWIGAALASRGIPSMRADSEVLWRDAFLLHEYARARRVIVGQEATSASSATVHRLLWGTPEHAKLTDWPMTAWETPAEGLPSRIAAALLRIVRQKPPPNGWAPDQRPLTWVINDVEGVLAAGRRWQFIPECEPEPAEQPLSMNMKRSTSWEVMPNAAFYRPFVSAPPGEVHMNSYVLYCDVLLLLTALDGAERILDSLVRWGVRGTPFEDRWAWRSRIHLPSEAWKSIEEILRWSESPESDVTETGGRLDESLADWSCETVSWEDFLPERIDVGLSLRPDLEIVRTICPASDLRGPDLPSELRVAENSIIDELVVRVGQVAEWPAETEVMKRFPAISSATANAMIEQVSNVFLAPAQGVGDAGPRLVVLPELAIPQQEVRSLRDLVRNEGKGAVAGLYWRALRPAFHPPRWFTPSQAYFVNEAELIVPVGDGRGPPAVRWFRVRKPVAAHMEDGLARAVEEYVKTKKKASCTKWRMLRGRRWYRFAHPGWGDFTVAICADLIDAAPWRALRGELVHLLMVAFNKDVDLFDSLTWVRAYENYVNVVSVNHGRYGGSFLWTPQRSHERELARLRGRELVLTADVALPIKELLRAQKKGVMEAIELSARKWQGRKSAHTKFKAPPPGFRRRD